jgi:UDP-glucose 4-epimerase
VKRVLITGGAGFIGSNLGDRLAADGCEVVVYDNFSSGRRDFVEGLISRPENRLVEGDILDTERLTAALDGVDTVFHFAANADVRHGLEAPRRDLEQNTLGTSSVLEAMRAAGVSRIAFSSTGSIYGEPEVFPTPEDAPFPTQTSLYGASKLAGEGLIAAYCTGYGFTATVFRFVSILGERYTHGHVYDFVRALRADPARLRVLGDGRQTKSYLYVQDCVAAILTAVAAGRPGTFSVYNLGTDETVVVNDSVGVITGALGLTPEIEHTGGERGWVGDSPLIHLDTRRIRSLGWEPQLTIREALEATVSWLTAHPEVLAEDPAARYGSGADGSAA